MQESLPGNTLYFNEQRPTTKTNIHADIRK